MTTRDFDSDCLIDAVMVGCSEANLDNILWNTRDGTFSVSNAGFKRKAKVHGDQPVAVDADMDGKLEIDLSEGDWNNVYREGNYRIMRLKAIAEQSLGSHILVHVDHSPTRRATPHHALIAVYLEKGKKLVTQVSSPGTCVSTSLIETVHCGVGPYKRIWKIVVKWINGETSQ